LKVERAVAAVFGKSAIDFVEFDGGIVGVVHSKSSLICRANNEFDGRYCLMYRFPVSSMRLCEML